MDEGQDGSVFVDSSIIVSPFRAFATGPPVEAAVAARGSIFYVEIAPIQSVLTSATSLHPTSKDLPSLSPDNKAIALWSSNFVVEENSGDDSDDDFFYHFRVER